MAKKRELTDEKQTHTVIHDAKGRKTFRFGFTEKTYEQEDGEYKQIIAENFTGGDGSINNTTTMLKSNLKLCDECELANQSSDTPIIPYSPADKMAICHHCNRNLCSRHTHRYEGKTLCKSCKRKLFWKHLLFFKKVAP